MKKAILRFDISIEPKQRVMVPYNSEILGFDVLNGKPGFNAIVEIGQKEMERQLLITTFAKELPHTANKTRFIGSFNIDKDSFFVFEE